MRTSSPTSLALVSLLALSACVVKVTEGDPKTGSTGGAPNGASPTPAPAPAPAPTGATPTTTATGTATPAPAPTGPAVGAPGTNPGVGAPTTPVKPGGPLTASKPSGFLLRPLEATKVIKQPTSFGLPTPSPTTIRGDVYAIAEGTKNLPANWLEMPILATLYTSDWNVSPRKFTEGFPGVSNRVEWFGIHWEGKFTVKAGGSFDFRLVSDDGARVWIDGVLTIDNDGAHPPKEAKGSAALNIGEHNLVVDYFQGPKYEIALQLFVKPVGQAEKVFTTVL